MGLIADGSAARCEKVGHDAGPIIDDGEEQHREVILNSSDDTDGAMNGLQGGIVLEWPLTPGNHAERPARALFECRHARQHEQTRTIIMVPHVRLSPAPIQDFVVVLSLISE